MQYNKMATTMYKGNSGMIEVDPKLFITCRLCLEEMGVYQIVPTVQQQIKYCFEITVEPFDGLPQLLCKKCKTLLDDYSSNKKKFIERQENLITKLKINQVEVTDAEIADTVHSNKSRSRSRSSSVNKISEDIRPRSPSIQSANEKVFDSDDNIKLSVSSCNKRRTRLLSNSSVDSERYFAPKKNTHKNLSKSSKWKKKYNKKFICNICPKSYKSKTKMVRHLDDHSNIKSQYPFILNKPCKVTLYKFDEKPNSTNLDNTVVYDHEKILQDAGNPLYHVLYTARNNCSKKTSKRQYLVSSDDDFSYNKKNRRTSRRSSNETVLLGDNYKITESSVGESPGSHKKTPEIKNAVETVCIDDSDSNTELEKNKNLKENTDIKVEFKSIENIITNCRIKYMNKFQNGSINSSKKVSSENHLKHKILSIGRKIIHKDGQFNCTGLLRYMEHKNLEVMWIPKVLDINSRENLVRIMPKLKSASNTDITSDKHRWITLTQVESNKTTSTISIPTASSVNESFNNSSICEVVPSAILSKSQAPVATTEMLNSSKSSHPDKRNIKSAVLYTDFNTTETDINSKRILNQSPVANPKQLPKKNSNTTESKLVGFSTKNMTEMVTNQSSNIDFREEISESSLSMPIITSTTSLAPLSENRKMAEKEPKVALVSDKSVPRIKVKPVSELMNPSTSNDNQNGLWAMNRFHNQAIPAPNVTMGNILENRAVPAPNVTIGNILDNRTIPAPNVTIGNILNNRAIPTPNVTIGNILENRPIPTSVGNVYLQILPQIQSVQSVQPPAVDQNAIMPLSVNTNEVATASHTDFIVLNSVELPNTKTDSPFRYCKDLLLLHNIYLLEPNITITQDYSNLLKMRVQFKEENKDKPIALCISLYCLGNSYCVAVFAICEHDNSLYFSFFYSMVRSYCQQNGKKYE
ncbi:unnamed protein product [Chilo suppressalis]|uniref:ZAD domain-containing protein n=1 Tax=Chilo suppressalis TaxID=168631 RepID=A0ABN8L754_CHISP|nr:unnamed protein product [Chilo suppressalis]